MLKTLRLVLLLSAFCTSIYAVTVPCTTASLHVYDTSGFSCSEGSEIFSNFLFSDAGTDNPLPTDNSVIVTPLVNGLEFDVGFLAPAGLTVDAVIRYNVTISSGTLTGDSLAIAGFGQSGSGALDVAESVCVGGLFNGSGVCAPPAFTDSLNVFDNSGGFKQSDSVTFSATTVDVVKDISLTGGTSGSANLSLVDNVMPLASAVPEPATLTLVGLALAGLVWAKRKR